MSFLAPLYLIATLAIGLPIAFHMIRRSPQGRQIFSSVMFLQPDPPRMTRRSRLEDWLLLLLRSAAICLLAFAFARPFLRTQASAEVGSDPGKKIVVLVDTSASLRRGDCWEQVQKAVSEIADEMNAKDSLSLLVFDDAVRELIGVETWKQLPVEVRSTEFRNALQNEKPGWRATRTGAALIRATELLDEEESQQAKKVILISDLQSGGGWDALNGDVWPNDIELKLIPVQPLEGSNASLQLADGTTPSPEFIRLRVTNSAASTNDAFHIRARDPFDGTDGSGPQSAVTSVSVPPGQSRVVNVPRGPGSEVGLAMILTGDQTDFDNTVYAVRESVQQLQVVYLGSAQEDPGPDGLRFFLNAVFPKTPWREVTIADWRDEDSPPVPPVTDSASVVRSDRPISWVIIGGTPSALQSEWIRNWIEKGGTALFVARNAEQAMSLYDILQCPPQMVEEVAQPGEYALLQNVDLTYPPLKQFNDPRFSDFTKIRFWKYRKFAPDFGPEFRVLATFENQSPALGEIPLGGGRVLLLTSGWNRSDSDLAVSSKFVPLMNGLLENVSPQRRQRFQYVVGQEVRLSDLKLAGETLTVLHKGREQTVNVQEPYRIEEPGLFRFGTTLQQAQGPEAILVAANLDPQESRTDPLPRDVLAAYGVKFEAPSSPLEKELSPQQRRQLMNAELESRQSWWRWLLLATLFLIFAESLIAALKANSRKLTPVEA